MLAGAELLAALLCAICPALPAAGMSRARGGALVGSKELLWTWGPALRSARRRPHLGHSFGLEDGCQRCLPRCGSRSRHM